MHHFFFFSLANGGRRELNLTDVLKSDTDTEVVRFHVPDLLIGTLDQLMISLDEVVELDQYIDTINGKLTQFLHEVSGSHDCITADENLAMYDVVRNFKWISARFPHQRPIPEVIELIRRNVRKCEQELLEISGSHGGNHVTAEREETLFVSKEDIIQTEYLQTYAVLIPDNALTVWVETYESLGETHLRPALPRSGKKVYATIDHYSLALVTVLRKHVDKFVFAVKEKQFIFKKLDENSNASLTRCERSNVDVEDARSVASNIRWCKSRLGDAIVCWVHTKAIRIFVESVLRFGLPVDFTAVVASKPSTAESNSFKSKLVALLCRDRKSVV